MRKAALVAAILAITSGPASAKCFLIFCWHDQHHRHHMHHHRVRPHIHVHKSRDRVVVIIKHEHAAPRQARIPELAPIAPLPE